MRICGYIGKPVISRGNRGYENYFINGRYIRSNVIARGIEEGYRTFMMQHKYPFTALHFTIDGKLLDVNVHPTKMELRFSNQEELYRFVRDTVRQGLMERELIPEVKLTEEPEKEETEKSIQPGGTRTASEQDAFTARKSPAQNASVFQESPAQNASAFQESPAQAAPVAQESPAQSGSTPQERNLEYFMAQMRKRVTEEFRQKNQQAENCPAEEEPKEQSKEEPKEEQVSGERPAERSSDGSVLRESGSYGAGMEKPLVEEVRIKESEQLDLFEQRLLNPAAKSDIRIIGQLFETYWLVQFEDKFYMIDQHAAHEKVLYERTVKKLAKKEITSQMVSPPLILTLSMQEAAKLEEYREYFAELGFEIEPFGGKEYAVSAVPANLFGLAEKDLFLELLDSLEYVNGKNTEMVLDKIASMSCKAAVKGNQRMSTAEAQALIEELLTLENPYNCPHGRPTIISMTKQEIEKKFKRIV